MARQIVIESRPTFNRRQPLLPPSGKRSNRVGEVAGETAAGCAAVCCCCPCTVVNLLILTVYKVPSGLCRRAWKNKKLQKKKKKAALQQIHGGMVMELETDDDEVEGWEDIEADASLREAAELEREMWAQFYGTGFWRSPSQRED